MKVLNNYAYYDSQQRKIYLSGIVGYGVLKERELKDSEKRTPVFRLSGVETRDCQVTLVCKNAVRNLFCVGLKSWIKLVDNVIIPRKRVLPHLNKNTFRSSKCTPEAILFLKKLGDDYGDS